MEVVFRKNTYNGPLVVETPGKYDLYTFDGSQSHEEWRWHPEVLVNGQGFLYADSIPDMASRTLSLTGTLVPSNDALSFDLAYTNTPFGAWNLVGNPFACNATSSIDNFYVINGTELVPASGPVAPLQGIFVMSTGSGQSVTFTAGTPSKAVPTLNISLFKADSRDAGIVDLARIRFDEGEGLEKFMLNPSHTKIYIPQDSKDYAVVNMGGNGVQTVTTMDVNFKATEDGRYTITVDPDGLEMAYLHLVDNMTGADVDLLALRQAQGPASYSFTAKTTDQESRFKLVFSANGDVNGDKVKTQKIIIQ